MNNRRRENKNTRNHKSFKKTSRASKATLSRPKKDYSKNNDNDGILRRAKNRAKSEIEA